MFPVQLDNSIVVLDEHVNRKKYWNDFEPSWKHCNGLTRADN